MNGIKAFLICSSDYVVTNVNVQVADQLKFLKKSVVHIAVGTPKRIQQILEQENGNLNVFTTL